MKSILAFFLAISLVAEPALAGIPKNKAQYSGGTVAAIAAGVIGPLKTTDPHKLIFDRKKHGKHPAGTWSVPYSEITSLAYGQPAGRRVGAAIAWGATTLGIMALPILFSKKRRHYLTIEYKDSKGVEQAAIFQIGKEAICPTITTIEAERKPHTRTKRRGSRDANRA